MKKIKFSSDFILSVGLLYVCAVIMHGAVLPYLKEDNGSASIISVKNNLPYNLVPSSLAEGFFSFNYEFDKSLINSKNEVSFDFPVKQFNKEEAQKYLNLYFPGTTFDNITDAWGYPRKENAFLPKKGLQKRGGGQAKSDEDPNVLGLVNCRANTDITGYFKAYFEDVALNNNIGYDDPTYGLARREEACQVLQDISEVIKLDETNITPDILFSNSNNNLPAGALAGASAFFGYYSNGPDNGSLHKHILSSIDPTPQQGFFDAFIITRFNGVSWDVDSELNQSTYDFYTVLYHEVIHLLGFKSSLSSTVSSNGEVGAFNTFNYFSYKDGFVNENESFIDHTDYELQVPNGVPPYWFISNQVVYQGSKNILNSSPDGIRPVFSPSGWQEGSSISHFDMNRSDGEIYVMNNSIGTNTERDIHNHELEVLCHLGYQVEGVQDCGVPTPWAENDTFLIDEELTLCLNVLDNDLNFGSGNLKLNSFNEVVVASGDTFSFYDNSNCSGAGSSDPSGKTHIKFSRLQTQNISRVVTYSVYNDQTNRISFPANLLINVCDVAEDEYLCNGGFELGYINYNNIASVQMLDCPPVIFPYVCGGHPSPDIFDRAFDFATPWLYNGPVDTHNGEPNNRYVYSGGGIMNTEEPYPGYAVYLNERVALKTKTILPPGQYTLSWYGAYSSPSSVSETSLDIFITSDMPDYSDFNPVNRQYVPEISDVFVNVPVEQITIADIMDSETDWQYYQTTITIPDNGVDYEYLMFNPKRILNTSDVDYLAGVRNAYDDVSLIKISDGVESDTISGFVYHDVNQDGVMQSTDPKLSGISVSIFAENSEEPITSTNTQSIPNLGYYDFSGLNPGNYYVVLSEESLFNGIITPENNSFVSGYNHAISTELINGQDSTNNNFGVVLDGEYDNPSYTNISVKKILLDSSISFLDRNITWSIEISNIGDETATEINVSEVIPSGLNYYTHLIGSLGSYNQNTGIISIPELQPGEVVLMNLVTRVPHGACGIKTNVASLTSFNGVDYEPGNNVSSAVFKLKPCKTDGTLNTGSLPG